MLELEQMKLIECCYTNRKYEQLYSVCVCLSELSNDFLWCVWCDKHRGAW